MGGATPPTDNKREVCDQMAVYDILVKNGMIVDGTGNPWFRGDIGIVGDKIKDIGQLAGATAEEVMDCTGLVVSPGFIDAHSHSEMTLVINNRADSKIRQGVTTEISGLCGFSAAPVPTRRQGEFALGASLVGFTCALARDVEFRWQTLEEYFSILQANGLPSNFGTYIGHMNLRLQTMGISPSECTSDELAAMKRILIKAMEDGAFGMSVALDKVTEKGSSTEEIIELCKVVGEFGGSYAQHQRFWGQRFSDSTREAVAIAKGAAVPAILSHHIPPLDIWESDRMILEKGRQSGVELYVDTIAYEYGSMGLHSMLPEWCVKESLDKIVADLRDPVTRAAIKKEVDEGRVQGLANNVLLVAPKNPELVGKTFKEIAAIKGKDLIEVALDLLLEEEMTVKTLGFGWPEDWLINVMRYENSFIESDAGALSPDGMLKIRADARGFGTFPRVLGYFVREKRALTLEDAIRKITSLPAQALRIKDRGLLRKGMYADIVVFDASTIGTQSTPLVPCQYPTGIKHVVVNGSLAVRNGEPVNLAAGKAIKL